MPKIETITCDICARACNATPGDPLLATFHSLASVDKFFCFACLIGIRMIVKSASWESTIRPAAVNAINNGTQPGS